MSFQTLNRASGAAASATGSGLLQRKCACGNRASVHGDRCPECAESLVPQPRLRIGAGNDPLEQEAERAAAQIMGAGLPAMTRRQTAIAPTLTRRSDREANRGAAAPASVHDTLQMPGEPLPDPTRAFFEPRFGHDFSTVRVHRDAASARSAREVDAQAYTVGRHIVFAAGAYAPDSGVGRRLIAHELAHVVQQGPTASQGNAEPACLRRRNIFQEIAGLFAGEDFDEQTLQDYLSFLRRTQRIEDYTDSDNKARAVVNAWRTGESPYVITEDLKALLIREMLSGFTGDADERAILELLERSYNYELSYIFGTGGVTVDALNRAFQGDEQACLSDFLTRRFRGGEEALARGTVQPRGTPTPFGDEVPTRCAYEVRFPGLGVEWSLPCVLGTLCSEDRQVVEALPHFDVEKVTTIEVDRWEYRGGSWQMTDTRYPAGAANAESTPPEIKILSSQSCEQAVRTIVHEVRHQHQPQGSRFERELDAYTYTERWAIDRGLPGYGNGFRETDPQTGAQTVAQSAVEAYVHRRYPGTQGGPGETIVGHRSSDDFTRISRTGAADYFRPPEPDDSHWGEPRYLGQDPIPATDWACPGPASAAGPALPGGVVRQGFTEQVTRSAEGL